MPKIMLAKSSKTKETKAATSPQKLKELIAARVEADAEDKNYSVATITTKLGLKNVVNLFNLSVKKIAKLPDTTVTKEKWTYDPSAKRKWEIVAEK